MPGFAFGNMIAPILFCFGLMLGSFGNVVSLRIHAKENGIMNGRSHCPKCGYQLRWYDNIPLFSWLFLKGKCRKCRKPISWQYPVAELLFGLLFMLVGLFSPADDIILLLWRLTIVFAAAILILSDLRYMDIPDEVSLPTIGFLLISSLAASYLLPSDGIPHISVALTGAAVLYGFFSLQVLLPAATVSLLRGKLKIFKQAVGAVLIFPVWLLFSLFFLGKWFDQKFEEEDGGDDLISWIGGGDLRIAIIMGLALGWKVGLLAVFISYLIGTLISVPLLLARTKDARQMIPFGPMLVAGLIICLLWGDLLLNWYLRLLGF